MSLVHENGALSLDTWKYRARVRLRANMGVVPAGTQGIVAEFFGPRGPDYWQIEFPRLGIINVPREDLDLLDPECVQVLRRRDGARLTRILQNADKAVLHVSNGGVFQRLHIWDAAGHAETVTEESRANKLVRLLVDKGVLVRRERGEA